MHDVLLRLCCSWHVLMCTCRYGRHMSEVSYFICHERETIDTIFNNLRKDRKVHTAIVHTHTYCWCDSHLFVCSQYPLKCGCSKVVSVLDLTVGYDSRSPPDYKPVSWTTVLYCGWWLSIWWTSIVCSLYGPQILAYHDWAVSRAYRLL